MRYELLRSDRKTLALTVDREGRVIARAPLHMPVSQVEAFIREKQGWFRQRASALRARRCLCRTARGT